jgi:hypothetical protein
MLPTLLEWLSEIPLPTSQLLGPCSQAGDHLGAYVKKQADFITAGSTVAVDLGSMPRMGFVPDAAGCMEAVHDALVVTKLRGLVLTGAAIQLARWHCCHLAMRTAFSQYDDVCRHRVLHSVSQHGIPGCRLISAPCRGMPLNRQARHC